MVKAKIQAVMAASAAMSLAVPALASEWVPTFSIVKVSDLDLTSDQGQRTAQRRLRSAVANACPTYGELNLRVRAKARECRERAFIDGQRKLAGQTHLQKQRLANSTAPSRGEGELGASQ